MVRFMLVNFACASKRNWASAFNPCHSFIFFYQSIKMPQICFKSINTSKTGIETKHQQQPQLTSMYMLETWWVTENPGVWDSCQPRSTPPIQGISALAILSGAERQGKRVTWNRRLSPKLKRLVNPMVGQIACKSNPDSQARPVGECIYARANYEWKD